MEMFRRRRRPHAVPRATIADRAWARDRLVEAISRLTNTTSQHISSGTSCSEPDLTARATLLNDVVAVEHYLRKLVMSYGILSEHRRLHTAQVAELKKARLADLYEVAAARQTIRTIDRALGPINSKESTHVNHPEN